MRECLSAQLRRGRKLNAGITEIDIVRQAEFYIECAKGVKRCRAFGDLVGTSIFYRIRNAGRGVARALDIAEFSAFAYDTHSGRPIALGARMAGTAKIRSHTLFMVFSWGQQEVRPGDASVASDQWWKVW